LDNAGPRYKMHDPSSWAQQADLADKNNWDKLVVLQKVLGSPDGKESDSKAEKLYLKFLGFANVKQNDHKVIEGIGPKIEGLLKDGGIKTWKELSESKVEDIQVILDAAGSRYKLANPSTWPKQAKLAADGDWTALKNYQDKLKGGKE
jgi:predicted flap endonuclease-1-like 5' DNA nuclease